ncbi:MAG: GPW/gp25 family protein [Gammaproteobacteria bacterium]|nr:GPW/gp25 family protein [Gammaproteobacteria bacterium]
MATRLNSPDYMKFPFEIGADGAQVSARRQHIREQIEQVLFTDPGERWFRPEFGVGIRALVFEPNSSLLWEVTKKRLLASLSDALQGEVDPATLEIAVHGEEAQLLITIGYTLATINHTEKVEFALEGR